MLRRVTAQQALLQLQDISADISDGEYSDSELDNALANDAQAELDSSREESDIDIILAKTMTAIYRIKT